MNVEQTGRIFSIEEFSTYDGPGIRMTVFMKGCPLRCMWCHNPEGQRFERELLRSPNGCLSCGACLRAGAEKTGTPSLVEESIGVCPRNLIRFCGEEHTPRSLCEILEKNLPILNMSGGGVTFSGGEPMSQWQFVGECLRLLHGKTHRALQTCGFASSEVFLSLLGECDYVLYDLKLMDRDEHIRYTGVSNEQILANYRLLAASGVPFITRIPLIPGVNDTEKNLSETAAWMRECGVNRIELLPYNQMAGGKYLMLGRAYEPTFDGILPPKEGREIFEFYGIEVRVL